MKSRLPILAQRVTAVQPPDSAGARELQVQEPSRFSISTTPFGGRPGRAHGRPHDGDGRRRFAHRVFEPGQHAAARGTARAKEMAIRLALGSSRWRIIRQLLCEGLLLAFAGGFLGLLVSLWSNGLLVRSLGTLFGSMSFSVALPVKPDALVLGVTFLSVLRPCSSVSGRR